jgi:hypothetical protein
MLFGPIDKESELLVAATYDATWLAILRVKGLFCLLIRVTRGTF